MKLFQLTAFGIGAAIVARLFPRRIRWILLLAVSALFYGSRSLNGLPFILLATLLTWVCGLVIERIEQNGKLTQTEKQQMTGEMRREHKRRIRQKKNTAVGITLGLMFLMLALFKYADQVFMLAGQSPIGFLLPLGISFYTFQSAGYLLDVAGGKIKAERSLPRFALFVCYFPQLIQGPIGRYGHLAPQLESPEDLTLDRFVRGFFLVLWGLIKKMVIADRTLPFLSAVFDAQPGTYGGQLSLLALLLYAVQQYCDFSGGIDLVIGISEWLGISLMPNFKRPYFAVNLADFWRRWHITLGSWMRDYVFYPFALSRPVARLSKGLGKYPSLARTLPAALGNLLVFFLVGLWHGATSNYILWGLYNGLILAVSALLEPFYKRHPLPANPAMHGFRILRTFIVVNIGWLFDRCASGGAAFSMLGTILTGWRPGEFTLDRLNELGLPWADRLVLICACLLLFLISLLQEKGIDIRKYLMRRYPVRVIMLLLGICTVLIFGIWGSGFNEASFIYLKF
ncbi:MAG: MBOAT family protein [Clostridia bacterium]|nr:MBOAT family protein [Clostridia bacterium]